ncbi:hypothetical protein VY88_06360 [Azospirillum thiophilum]|uniref:Uncharacterized protein n=1 Tax=Azospirillum thiophilum TaxID=528244 RepID=A0AAC8VW96_9PROT|nr:hypothetical protein AL072_06350 [Azospirillum thiophilum]KJR65738.1 hypothetical protein VY88_06360 [Azospirillum thiophilum]
MRLPSISAFSPLPSGVGVSVTLVTMRRTTSVMRAPPPSITKLSTTRRYASARVAASGTSGIGAVASAMAAFTASASASSAASFAARAAERIPVAIASTMFDTWPSSDANLRRRAAVSLPASAPTRATNSRMLATPFASTSGWRSQCRRASTTRPSMSPSLTFRPLPQVPLERWRLHP